MRNKKKKKRKEKKTNEKKIEEKKEKPMEKVFFLSNIKAITLIQYKAGFSKVNKRQSKMSDKLLIASHTFRAN